MDSEKKNFLQKVKVFISVSLLILYCGYIMKFLF